MRFWTVTILLAACASGGQPGGSGSAGNETQSTAPVAHSRTGGPLLVSAFLPPTGYVGVAYQYATIVSGGAEPISIDLAGLPPGLAYDPTTGMIAGTPGAVGSYTVVRSVRDANNEGDISQSMLTILDNGSFIPVSLSLHDCVVPHDKARLVAATASGIDYGSPGTAKKCVRDVAFAHDTYRDLLKQSVTAPRFVFDFPGVNALVYTVLVGPTEFARGSLDKTSAGFELALSEEQLKKSFSTWRNSEIVTVRVGDDNQSLDVVLSLSFLATPVFIGDASALVHAGFRTFAYSEDSIDTIFGGSGNRVFIAAGRELRNVSGSPIVVSLSADPSAFAANFERQVKAAYLTGASQFPLQSGSVYPSANCPSDHAYYRPPATAPSPCPPSFCPLGIMPSQAFVCAPKTANAHFQVSPQPTSSHQFGTFYIQTFELAEHEESVAVSEDVAFVGAWSDVNTTIPAAFSDGVNSARIGIDARTMSLAPGQSVWLGFGISRPSMHTSPIRDIAYLNPAGATVTYSDRMDCIERTSIFDEIAPPPHILALSKMRERRRIEAESLLRVSLTGSVTGEIIGAQTPLPLFDRTSHFAFDYNAEATHEIDERTFELPPSACP